MRELVGLSRLDVIAWYFEENPEMKRWVDRNIEAGTCTDAVAEFRAKREDFRRWRQEQREDLPARPAKNAGGNKQRPTNPAVRQWMRGRVDSWPDDKLTPTEGDDWDAVQQHFAPGLSRDAFRIVRREETPPEWRKQGPRKPWGQIKK
jgi:hypothetical protein